MPLNTPWFDNGVNEVSDQYQLVLDEQQYTLFLTFLQDLEYQHEITDMFKHSPHSNETWQTVKTVAKQLEWWAQNVIGSPE
jgi:hypothetical protein